jgi:DNA-binding transcriptional regulator GbsR (MarR family)
VVKERKAREFDPTVGVLRSLVDSADFSREDAGTQQRIRETLALMEVLATWADEMMELQPETLMKILKLGARIQNLLAKARGKSKASEK